MLVSMSPDRRTQAERTDATTRALIAAARRLFAEKGFSDTSTNDIVSAAAVTRGALYHHFADKTDLFRAVYEQVEAELVERVAQAAFAEQRDTPEQTALAHLRTGAEEFLHACLEPVVQRITLIEAPAVLGWQQWKELDAQYGLGLVRLALQRAMDAGAVREVPLDAASHVVLGAVTEAALMAARANDSEQARGEAMEVVHALIDGLRPK
jgi:AcrR family transcriptional regulator